ncbi:zinc carboxypeptidase-like [Anticarsia gemmatalis]|uniref:zinc carboxypeptidase-like n=1 Tax=Anticarsia gemmatalis TaxID=129554 RepID=UPI003F757EFF
MYTKVIYLIVFIYSTKVCVGKDYSNYTLFRAIPVNEDHIKFFENLDEFYDVNFWRHPGEVNKTIDFTINPSQQPAFLRDAERHGVYLTTMIDDVQTAFNQQQPTTYVRSQVSSFDWKNYYRLLDIHWWLKDLARKYPREMKIMSIGKTKERRDILAVKVLLKGARPKTSVVVEGGVHAREWIAPAFVTYLISQIVQADSSGDYELRKIANSFEWYFVPCINPDGYEYTHTIDRMWRKNRNGHGTDINRNFAHGFGTVGVSKKKTADIYCGEKAFSEKESKAMADFVTETNKQRKIEFYLAFHAYGQYMIIPYTDSKKHVENFDEVYKICKRAARKIEDKYGTEYTMGTAYDTVGYMTSGVSGCWVKKTFQVPYVITFELRDTGSYGFALPPKEILPTCRETMDGVMEVLRSSGSVRNVLFSNSHSHKTKAQFVVICTLLTIYYFYITK